MNLMTTAFRNELILACLLLPWPWVGDFLQIGTEGAVVAG
jgi:hypothetical protein